MTPTSFKSSYTDKSPLSQLGGPFQNMSGPGELWEERGGTSKDFKGQP